MLNESLRAKAYNGSRYDNGSIAVALIGAAVTLGLAIRESQKGKTQGPAIIDNQHASQGQR
jgi:hypothetical protein